MTTDSAGVARVPLEAAESAVRLAVRGYRSVQSAMRPGAKEVIVLDRER